MNTAQLLLHLKQSHLLPQAKQVAKRLESVFTKCLKADHQEVLIITDTGKHGRSLAPTLAGGYYLAAKALELPTTVVMQQFRAKGQQADLHVQQALEHSGFGHIVILVVNALGTTPLIGRSFRKFMNFRKHTFISCTGLASLKNEQFPALISAIDTDYALMQRRTSYLHHALSQGKELRVTTPTGTDMWIGIKGKKPHSNDGHFGKDVHGGNLPAGEVYIAPRKKQVEGTIVIDGSSRSVIGTALVKTPITLTVEKGDIVQVEGGVEAKLLEQSLDWADTHSKYSWGIRRIGEFGIGCNPNASLVGAMIIDEKVPGTAHIAIGSNHWFGGTVYALIHLDQVLQHPTVAVDGQQLDKSRYS